MQADFRSSELDLARELSEALLTQFEDAQDGGFYFVGQEHEPLILRPKSGHDNATPSGNAVAALALLRMGYVLGETRYLESAERVLLLFVPLMTRRPGGFATMNMALNEALEPTRLVVLRGSPEQLEQWRSELAGRIDGSLLVLALDTQLKGLPDALDKPGQRGAVNAYLCEGVSCLKPVQEIGELCALLNEVEGAGKER
jgi:hypothetical protein